LASADKKRAWITPSSSSTTGCFFDSGLVLFCLDLR
jgi:hypothetical protein